MKRAALVCLMLSMGAVHAGVLVDDMGGIANKTYAGGYVFDISSHGTTWEWPDPALSWTYYDSKDFGGPDEGVFARVHGTLGGVEDYPFIGYGCYLTLGKDTLDLSQSVSAFAFQARGVGNWRFKFRNKLIDSLAVKAGKTGEQVAWMMEVSVTEQWQWFVLPVEGFSANVGDVNTLFAQKFESADAMTSIYKVYWQTDGYTSADEGTEVRIDVDNFYLLGSISELGMSDSTVDAGHCGQINAVSPGACGNSAVRRPLRMRRGGAPASAGAGLFSIDGRLLRTRRTDNEPLSHGVYILDEADGTASRMNSITVRPNSASD
jgi:hypothetical protein